jgi:hypothetical protein
VSIDEFLSLCYALTALPVELLLPRGRDLDIEDIKVRFPGWPEHLGLEAVQPWLGSAFRIGWDQPAIRIDRESGQIVPPQEEEQR